MAEERNSDRLVRSRWRLAAAAGISAILLASYFLISDEEERGRPEPAADVDTESSPSELDILEVIPNEVTPGSAVELRFTGGKEKGAPLKVQVSQSRRDYKETAELLHRQGDRLFVRIPGEALVGTAKLRLLQGDDKSKPYDLRVKPLDRRKLFRSVLGGLALLLFGLHTMSTGVRAYAGQRSQGILTRIAGRTPAAIGLGFLVGGLTQFTTTAAGLVVGLIESHLLAVGPALAILIGAQVGAGAMPSVVGMAATKEGLLVIVVGVIWTGLALDRRSKALGRIILGCGLLFYGLHILRMGFEPLVTDPELLPYTALLDASKAKGLLTCVLTGAVLAAILQGPGPVLVIIFGLAQSSGHIDLRSALAILAGTSLGSAIGTGAVAWPFGPESRRLARAHLLVGAAGTLLLASTVDLWSLLTDAMVSGHPGEIVYGTKVLMPNIGGHLAVGFVLSQTVAAVLCGAALPLIMKLVGGSAAPSIFADQASGGPLGTAGVKLLRTGLVRVLTLDRAALEAILDLCLSGHRASGTEGEHALADARSQLESMFVGVLRSRPNEPEVGRLRQAALATFHLQRAIEDLLRHAERSTERKLAGSPAGKEWHLPATDAVMLERLQQLVLEGIEALVRQLESGATPDLDTARSREIRLNAMEMDVRQGLLMDADRGETSQVIALRLNSTDLVIAYESVGNHLYRLYEALASEIDQDDAQAN